MGRLLIAVHVPPGLDLAKAERSARAAAQAAVYDLARDMRRNGEMLAALETDEGFDAWVGDHCAPGAPIVRAEVYEKITDAQRIAISWPGENSPRRPVAMRGALAILKDKYDCDGWCGRVIERYLRMTRWTCVDRGEILDTLGRLRARLVKKRTILGWGPGSRSELCGSDGRLLRPQSGMSPADIVWVKGRRRRLTDEQITGINDLKRLVEKTHKLDAAAGRLATREASDPAMGAGPM